MTLIKRHDRADGQTHIHDTLLAYGSLNDGWYVKLDLWFTKKEMPYTNVYNFETKVGPCRKVYLWNYRKKNRKLYTISWWVPYY
jgi:hypothetical protein